MLVWEGGKINYELGKLRNTERRGAGDYEKRKTNSERTGMDKIWGKEGRRMLREYKEVRTKVGRMNENQGER